MRHRKPIDLLLSNYWYRLGVDGLPSSYRWAIDDLMRNNLIYRGANDLPAIDYLSALYPPIIHKLSTSHWRKNDYVLASFQNVFQEKFSLKKLKSFCRAFSELSTSFWPTFNIYLTIDEKSGIYWQIIDQMRFNISNNETRRSMGKLSTCYLWTIIVLPACSNRRTINKLSMRYCTVLRLLGV